MFILRDYEKRDFETLFKLDRLCFDEGIAYSRPELASFIEQRRAYTIVAEWGEPTAQPVPTSEAVTSEVMKFGAVTPHAATPDGVTDPVAEAGSPSAVATVTSAPVKSHCKAKPQLPRRPIAGFVTFHLQKQGYGHIITIDVHPDARRHRLGTQLIAAACDKLRKMTAFMVVLEVAVNNHSALAFYDKHGFKRIKVLERYYNRDVDAIFMTKRL
jgi:ribosomal protein S18 acetylase RimI-like enzyme